MPPKTESKAVNVCFMIFTSISIAQILKFKYFSVLYMALFIFTIKLARCELTLHNREICVYHAFIVYCIGRIIHVYMKIRIHRHLCIFITI